MRSNLLFCIVFFCVAQSIAQQSNDINQSIISQAIFNSNSELTVSWLPKADASSYRIQYRTEMSNVWQSAATGIMDSFYTFPQLWNSPIEVSISTENGAFATSYILAGNEYFKADQVEHMLLIITDSVYNALESTIEEYRDVLALEMIKTDIIIVNQDANVTEVKGQIVAENTEEALDYILILGHVPVPYSGNSAIDGHTPDHEGAWVADGFYGDLDGNWTDVSVNNILANREATKNIPGDGKFDQSFFPSDIEIPVGRVDFSDLPKLLQSEVELTRRYLLRNMEYRSGNMKATRRAIIDNNFNLAEGFAQGAIKSFHTFLEPDSINFDNFTQCTTQDYLFTFGAGAGSYESAGGIINTNTLVNDSIQSIFTTIFGSYFGDWDITNNLLRASLARGSSLINAWSGRPIWYFHQMAMGDNVGNILLNTQNNTGNYTSQFGKKMCHTSLLGDPSLKMYYHPAISNPVIDADQISWEYLADDSEVIGYTVYYNDDEKWTLVGEGPRTESFIKFSELPFEGLGEILIRPVGLIASRSGSYYNEGIGVTAEFQITNIANELLESFKIYPNPADDFIAISGPQEIEHVQIFDAFGQLVKSSNGNTKIHIGSLTPGVYFMFINQQAIRFVKQ